MSDPSSAQTTNPDGPRHYRRSIIVILAALLGIAAVAWWLARADSQAVGTATVTRQPLAQSITTTGAIEPVRLTNARTTVSGVIELLAVEPGDIIVPGDIVAQLERDRFQRALTTAERGLETAELTQSQAAVVAASGTPADHVGALVAAQRADDARAALDHAAADLTHATVLAPAGGTVLEVHVNEGDPYQAAAPIVTINADNRIQVRADLDEVDVPHVEPGTTVQIVVDAFPGHVLTGHIERISPGGSRQGAGVVFPITIALDSPTDLPLRPGMSASVEIPSHVVEDALTVPADAITTVGRRAFVTVLRDGDEVRVEVRTGLRADGLVEVAAGDVESGELVRLQSTDSS